VSAVSSLTVGIDAIRIRVLVILSFALLVLSGVIILAVGIIVRSITACVRRLVIFIVLLLALLLFAIVSTRLNDLAGLEPALRPAFDHCRRTRRLRGFGVVSACQREGVLRAHDGFLERESVLIGVPERDAVPDELIAVEAVVFAPERATDEISYDGGEHDDTDETATDNTNEATDTGAG